jgi:hypothetical protein
VDKSQERKGKEKIRGHTMKKTEAKTTRESEENPRWGNAWTFKLGLFSGNCLGSTCRSLRLQTIIVIGLSVIYSIIYQPGQLAFH